MRLRMKRIWMYVVLSFLIAWAFALGPLAPLFLFQARTAYRATAKLAQYSLRPLKMVLTARSQCAALPALASSW
jgi:hypothetical protein